MFSEAKKLVEDSNKIYIVGHVNPDGDSIGSAFGMCIALRNLGKDARVVLPKYSTTFSFLPHISEYSVEFIEDEEYDLLICVDSSDKDRLAIKPEDYDKAKKVLMLDHHEKKVPYGDVNCIYSDLPAASQIIFNFLEYMNVNITPEIAIYLYMGIMTDTGSFNYSSTKPSTFVAVSKLISTGIDFADICKRVNDTKKESILYLIRETINNMEVYFDGQIRYSYIPYSTIKELGIDEEDAEGMTNYLRMVEGTQVAVYVRGKSDGTNKVSLRSSGKVDVSKVAIEFGGGGHKRASGYTMPEDYETSKEKLLSMLGGML